MKLRIFNEMQKLCHKYEGIWHKRILTPMASGQIWYRGAQTPTMPAQPMPDLPSGSRMILPDDPGDANTLMVISDGHEYVDRIWQRGAEYFRSGHEDDDLYVDRAIRMPKVPILECSYCNAVFAPDYYMRLLRELLEIELLNPDQRRQHLRGMDCSYGKYRKFDFRGAEMPYNLRGADLRETRLGEADFSGCDLRDADLRGAELAGADLSHAWLVGAKLDGAMVEGVDWSGVVDGYATYSNWMESVDFVTRTIARFRSRPKLAKVYDNAESYSVPAKSIVDRVSQLLVDSDVKEAILIAPKPAYTLLTSGEHWYGFELKMSEGKVDGGSVHYAASSATGFDSGDMGLRKGRQPTTNQLIPLIQKYLHIGGSFAPRKYRRIEEVGGWTVVLASDYTLDPKLRYTSKLGYASIRKTKQEES